MAVATKLRNIRTELNDMYFERADTIDALMLATLAKQHAFILGPPGTGKSELVREFAARITGGKYFEQLLSKNRADAAVLGPYDLSLLRDKSEFKRKDAGFLTDAHFVFLDEIGKASPTLSHDLLAALNERVKHEVNEGRSAHSIPLHSAFTASNELPASESDDMAALWDRLLVRTVVDYIQSPGDFKSLLERADATSAQRTTVTLEEVQEAVDAAASVVIVDSVMDLILDIRSNLAKDGITVSDRRWRAAMRLVRGNAYLADREVADPEDLQALRFALWDGPEHLRKVERIVLRSANPDAEEAAEILDGINHIAASLIAAKKDKSAEDYYRVATGSLTELTKYTKAAAKLKAKAEREGRSTERLDSVVEAAVDVRSIILKHMGMEDMIIE